MSSGPACAAARHRMMVEQHFVTAAVEAGEVGVQYRTAAQERGLLRVKFVRSGLAVRVQHEHATLARRQPRPLPGAQRRGADSQKHVVSVAELLHRADLDAVAPYAGLDHRRRRAKVAAVVRYHAAGRAAQTRRTMSRHCRQESDVALAFLARQRPDAVPTLAGECRIVRVPARIRPAYVFLVRQARPMQQVIRLGKEDLLQVRAFLREVKHELLADPPDHASAQPNRVIGLVNNGAVVVEVDAVSGYGHAHSVPAHIRARVVQIEEIVFALVVIEPSVPHTRDDAGFEDHFQFLSDGN